MNLPAIDELFVASDLHLGGTPGFQIFNKGSRLAGFIRWVGRQQPEREVALVLNGDIIDTLAEETSGYIATIDAESVTTRIIDDSAFSMIFEALKEFVALDRRHLIIVLGNHDLELALPGVQRLILGRLTDGNPAARGRIEFSTLGAGYPCMVGHSRVFCIHGNEVDEWNFVRYEALSKLARRLNAGRQFEPGEWEPNAGTKMVKDVMNGIKLRYAWIDLLKPEDWAPIGVLLAIDPSQRSKINSVVPLIGEKTIEKREMQQRLSGEGFQTGAVRAADRQEPLLLGPKLSARLHAVGRETADDMMRTAELQHGKKHSDSDSDDDTLGSFKMVVDQILGVPLEERLRDALSDWLRGDKSFEFDTKDPTFTRITDFVSPSVDFIITGHTHLARAIPLGSGRAYFNCGTWIRLLRITDEMLATADAFKPLFQVFNDGSMNAIDRANLVMDDRTTAVRIQKVEGGVVGELATITDSAENPWKMLKEFRR